MQRLYIQRTKRANCHTHTVGNHPAITKDPPALNPSSTLNTRNLDRGTRLTTSYDLPPNHPPTTAFFPEHLAR